MRTLYVKLFNSTYTNMSTIEYIHEMLATAPASEDSYVRTTMAKDEEVVTPRTPRNRHLERSETLGGAVERDQRTNQVWWI